MLHHASDDLHFALPHCLQVRLAGIGLQLRTKDKKTAVRLRMADSHDGSGSDDDAFRAGSGRSSAGSRGAPPTAVQAEVVLAEPQTFYRLADGSWWLEYCRFYTAAQAEAAAAEAGKALALPPGFDRSCELLRALRREHAGMDDVAGEWGNGRCGCR